ncbi:MAG: hypothetical protein IAE97_10925 [Chthoniobacterales bacterium]|nr:hypothetical protein [Chthoniobacterales bacterium]
MKRHTRYIAAIISASALLTCGTGAALAQTTTFNFTGAVQTWVVPLDVTHISFTLTGATGGNAFGSYTVYGGYGGSVSGILPVLPGSTLYIVVGGFGDDSNTTALGGYNGGGAGSVGSSSGGGGATDLRGGVGDLLDRIAVAGGGGGASSALGYGGGGGNFGPFNTTLGVGSDSWKGGGGGGYYGGAEGLFNGRGGSNYLPPEVIDGISVTDTVGRLVPDKLHGTATITVVPEPSVVTLIAIAGALTASARLTRIRNVSRSPRN